jgi:transposase-like protein
MYVMTPTPVKNLLKQVRKARVYSRERGALLRRFAAEQGISLPTAWRRIYRQADRLDADGNLIRKERADKGIPKKHHVPPEKLAILKTLFRDQQRTFASIAREVGINARTLRRIYKNKNLWKTPPPAPDHPPL